MRNHHHHPRPSAHQMPHEPGQLLGIHMPPLRAAAAARAAPQHRNLAELVHWGRRPDCQLGAAAVTGRAALRPHTLDDKTTSAAARPEKFRLPGKNGQEKHPERHFTREIRTHGGRTFPEKKVCSVPTNSRGRRNSSAPPLAVGELFFKFLNICLVFLDEPGRVLPGKKSTPTSADNTG